MVKEESRDHFSNGTLRAALASHTYPGFHHISLPVKLLKGIHIIQVWLPSSQCLGQRGYLFIQNLDLGGNLILVLSFFLWCQGWEDELGSHSEELETWFPGTITKLEILLSKTPKYYPQIYCNYSILKYGQEWYFHSRIWTIVAYLFTQLWFYLWSF